MKRSLLWIILTIGWALLIFRLTTYPQVVVTEDSFFQMIMMMGAHFFFFGVQAAFTYLLIYSFSLRKQINSIAILLASFYGLAIELIQRSVPGRSADPIDWLLDTMGAFVFISIVRKYIHIHN